MQSNIVIGNVARIQELANTNRKVYMTIADHYSAKDANTGKYEKNTRFVPVEGFLPAGLNIQVGQLVAVRFTVTQYKKKDGTYAVANDIDSIDVTLNNMSRKDAEAEADAADAAVAAEEAK